MKTGKTSNFSFEFSILYKFFESPRLKNLFRIKNFDDPCLKSCDDPRWWPLLLDLNFKTQKP